MLAKGTQSDSQPLSSDCAPVLKDYSGPANAAVTKVSKKRAAEVSSAEPGAKQATVAEGGNAVARRRYQSSLQPGLINPSSRIACKLSISQRQIAACSTCPFRQDLTGMMQKA